MGLFQNFGQSSMSPTSQGLLGMGQQLMEAGQPSYQPTSVGDAAMQGGQAFMQGYQDALGTQQNQDAVDEVFQPYTFEGMSTVGQQPGLLGDLTDVGGQMMDYGGQALDWLGSLGGQGNPGVTMPAYGREPGPTGMSGSF